MNLTPGLRLGPYQILSLLGSGGMGEVYRARDTRLGREVALKVVHSRFASDVEHLRRFEKEARAASQLDHPNILVVHDVGTYEGSPYIVSELLQGESLREKLGSHVPPGKAIEYALQVARGLAVAHEKGIVHRDIKPENLFVTKDGHVKILDFGIAKLLPGFEGPGADTETPTETATQAGTALGTVAYMSPEQAQGRAIDFQSDQFSLGVVLYEMLAGKRPFRGGSAAETLAAILREEPEPVTKLEPKVPAILGWIVQRCLSKDPEERYSSTRDLAKELTNLGLHLSEAANAVAVRVSEPPPLRRRVPMWALGVVGVLAALLGSLLGTRLLRPRVPLPAPLSLTLSFPLDAVPDAINTNPFALSPDGRTLVYAGTRAGRRRLFVRPLDRDEVREIPETDGARHPFFSPDGLSVGFFGEKKLKRVALAGGPPIALCDAPNDRGGSWGPDGTIVLVPAPRLGLQRIPAAGGEPKAVMLPDPETEIDSFPQRPQILPDGESVLFEVRSLIRASRAAAVSLKTGKRQIILEDAAVPKYLPTGDLVFARQGLIYAAPFDLKRLRTTGAPLPLLQDAFTERLGSEDAPFVFSQEGTLIYATNELFQRTLVWVDQKGAIERTPFPAAEYRYLALSPDGGRVAVITGEKAEAESLSIGDLNRGTLTRSTAEGMFQLLAWSPDGKRIAFGFQPEGKHLWQVVWQSADGSSAPERLGPEMANQSLPISFSPDGSALLVQTINFALTGPTSPTDMHFETLVLPLTGGEKGHPLFPSKADVTRARFSPDGRWVAYESNESEGANATTRSVRWEIYVQPYPGPGPKWQVSIDGGRDPRWSRNGRELFYRQGSRMLAVDVDLKPTFRAGRPKTLFEGQHLDTGLFMSNSYDVSPDGTRFLMIKPDPAEGTPARVKVVLNWFEEVKRRASQEK